MCGVPIHAIDNYLPKLVAAGYSCVLVSQVEDSAKKSGKGMVRREVRRIITPGVRYADDGLEETQFNYLAAALIGPRGGGAVAYVDVSTGNLHLANAEHLDGLHELLQRVRPAELLLPTQRADSWTEIVWRA